MRQRCCNYFYNYCTTARQFLYNKVMLAMIFLLHTAKAFESFFQSTITQWWRSHILYHRQLDKITSFWTLVYGVFVCINFKLSWNHMQIATIVSLNRLMQYLYATVNDIILVGKNCFDHDLYENLVARKLNVLTSFFVL